MCTDVISVDYEHIITVFVDFYQAHTTSIFSITATVAKQIIRPIHLGKWSMYLVNHNARHLLLY